MKRFGYISPRRQKITQDAIEQLRETRSQIDPELLEQVREAIYSSPLTDPLVLSRPVSSDMPEKIAVDPARMLEVAVKFLELCPDNKPLQKEIASFISSQ